MVAIIRCDHDEANLSNSSEQVATRRGQEWTLEVTRRQKIWTHPGAHLTILIDKLSGTDYITNLGWTAKRKRSEELNQVLEISRIESLATPVQYSDVEDLIPERLMSHLVHEGTLPPGTGVALVDALVQARPDLRHVVKRIEGASRQYQVSDSVAGQILAMQRDARGPWARSEWREWTAASSPGGTGPAPPVGRSHRAELYRRSARVPQRAGTEGTGGPSDRP